MLLPLGLLLSACGGQGTVSGALGGGQASGGGSSSDSTPTIASVSPASGSAAGGTLVTITGQDFDPSATVVVGLTEITPLSVSPTEMQVETAAHDPGTFSVWVINPGQQVGAMFNAFTFTAAPGDAPIFTNVTRSAGIDFIHQAGPDQGMGVGAAVADFDGDGWEDFYLTNQVGANALYLNQQDGTFLEQAAAAGLALDGSIDNGACAADYDNDGDPDLYVTADGPNHLFRNNGDGTFTDITATAAVGNSARGMTCAWGDFDGDGLLDLYVANYGDEDEQLPDPDALYRNAGGATFEDVTSVLPSAVSGNLAFAVSWVDFDGDADVDFYVVNDFGELVEPNILVRNDGPSSDLSWPFTDVSRSSGADMAQFGMGLAVGDYNADGWLDFYSTDIGAQLLLRNDADGTFTDVTDAAGVGRSVVLQTGVSTVGWGTFFFDFDNDGDEDLYFVAGPVEPFVDFQGGTQPNALFRNEADGTFTDISSGSGTNDPGRGRGGAYFDFDRDGDLDILVANFNQAPVLLRNDQTTGNAWLAVRLVGSASNRDGLGARLLVTAGGLTRVREARSGSSHCSNNTRWIHFGLGTEETVDELQVEWPGGTVQTFFAVPARQFLTVNEP